MDKKFKLIGFDIDGTILTNEHKVCRRLIDIVNKLKQKGYIFTLVTARFPISALKVAKELGLSQNEHIITLNGSYITNAMHDTIYSQTFKTTTINTLFEQIHPDITINYYSGFIWMVNQYTKFTEQELFFCKESTPPKIGKIENVNKITLNGEAQALIKIKTILAQDTSLLVALSHPNYLEVSTTNISKWHGLKHYASTLNIMPEEIIAFGDGENDIPMLQNAGLGVAMGNAPSHVKQMAKDVAGHNNEEGVAIYLEELLHNLR